MAGLTQQEIESIRQDLTEGDFPRLVQGLEALSHGVSSEAELRSCLGYAEAADTVDSLGSSLPDSQFPGHLLLWTLAKLAELGTDWVVELTEIDLRYTKVNALPDSIRNLQKLESLSLSRAGLTAVPPQVKDLPSLRRLNLESNKIEALPEWLDRLSGVTEIGLSRTSVKSLDHIEKMGQLESLDISCTSLTSLVPLAGLTSLRKLNIFGCVRLVNLEGLGPLKQLEELTVYEMGYRVTSLDEDSRVGMLKDHPHLDYDQLRVNTEPWCSSCGEPKQFCCC